MDSDRKCRALGLQPLKEFRDPAQTLTQLNYLNDGNEGMRADDVAGAARIVSVSLVGWPRLPKLRPSKAGPLCSTSRRITCAWAARERQRDAQSAAMPSFNLADNFRWRHQIATIKPH
jgi:hypothetical protein